MGRLDGGDRTRLEEVLVDTNHGDVVAAGHIGHLLDVASHHDECALDRFEEQVLFGSGDVVGSHDADLLSGGHGSGEDAAERVEASLVAGGNHLRHVHHEGSVLVALGDGLARLIVGGSLVKLGSAVLLRAGGRGKVDDKHFQKRIGGGEPLLHDDLEEGLSGELLLVVLEHDAARLEHLLHLLLLIVGDRVAHLLDGAEAELHEGALKALGKVLVGVALLPLLRLGVEKVVTPEAAHHIGGFDAKLLRVHDSKLLEREAPLVETRAKGHGTAGGVDLDDAHAAGLLVRLGIIGLEG